MDRLEWLAVLGVLAVFGALAWLLSRWERKAPVWEDDPLECGYCGRGLGTRSRHGGIGMQGKWFCDTLCYVGAERRDMDERSLGHRG